MKTKREYNRSLLRSTITYIGTFYMVLGVVIIIIYGALEKMGVTSELLRFLTLFLLIFASTMIGSRVFEKCFDPNRFIKEDNNRWRDQA